MSSFECGDAAIAYSIPHLGGGRGGMKVSGEGGRGGMKVSREGGRRGGGR